MKNKRKSKKPNLFKSAINRRTRLELLLALFLAITLAAAFERSAKVSYLSGELSPSARNFTSPAETTVAPQAIAQKIDYSRKIVSVKAGQAEAFKRQVTSLGGTVTDQISATSFVINLPQQNHEELTSTLQNSGTVSHIEVDYPAAISADRVDWGIERIMAPKVWTTTNGQNVPIAVLDTGVDETHPDLSGSVIARYNFISDTASAADGHGHGTHVAGTAASIQNGSGMQGGSYGAKILAGKVLADDGVGYLSDVVEGINWAAANGARIINLSLGTTYDSQLLEDTVNQAAAKGIVVVAAAGNTGGTMLFPAAYSSVLSVGATDTSNNLASFSARGASVVAPGVGITSTLPGNRYASWSGTSMAAPHVSAAAALLIAAGETNPKDKLRSHAVDLGETGFDSKYGYGLINIESSLGSADDIAPIVTILSPADNSSYSGGRLTISAVSTDESGVSGVEFILDGQLLNSFTAEPYQAPVTVNKLAEGQHTLVVKSTDKKGNVGQAQVTFSVTAPGSKENTSKSNQPVRPESTSPPTGTNLEERVEQGNNGKNDKRKRSLLQNFLSIFSKL